MTPQIFTEAIDLSEATIDTDSRTLRGVVLIRAGESANKRDYPADVLQASVGIFEGVKAYADHPTRTSLKERAERSIRDITGWYANVRYEGERLVADRHFTPTQAGQDAWALAEMVASGQAPKSLAGLSINAVGRARKRDDGGVVVEAITHAHSVDDVTTPAAGGSYIESVTGDELTQALVEALDYDEWLNLRPEFQERFKNEHRKARWNADLKETKDQVSEYAARCEQLEAERDQLQESLIQARAETQQAVRRVLVVETLAGVNLPVNWKTSLQAELLEADMNQWSAIVQREISKAKSAGHKPRVPVNVPEPQTTPQPQLVMKESYAPLDGEDPETWAARIQRMRQGQ